MDADGSGVEFAQVTLDNYNNQQYTGEMWFGTPPQKMTATFDTGSAILYVLSDRCKLCPKDKTNYSPAGSSSFRGTGKRESQPYGSGSIAGEIAQDSVCFSSSSGDCIDNVSFIAVDKASDIANDRFGALVGLSPFNAESNPNLPSFISQSEKQFSFFLPKGDGSQGKIVLGGYDLSQYANEGASDADISWSNLVDDSWTIPMNGLKF